MVNVAVGATELQVAKGARQVAREMEREGVKQVMHGAEEVGQAETIGVVADVLDEAAQ